MRRQSYVERASLDALVTPEAPPFSPAQRRRGTPSVPPEHTYRLAASLARNDVPHGRIRVSLSTASQQLREKWTGMAWRWLGEYI